MKTFKVSYTGNATRFKNFSDIVNAETERAAVISVYARVLDSDYFPQDDGSIRDCDGNEIADANSSTVDYDGGHFYAEEETYDVFFNDEESSNNKGFEATLEYCRNYIRMYAGTNESYFGDYKGGSVSIVSNLTEDVIEVYAAGTGEKIS